MTTNKVKIEIWEGDPFTGCCGPGKSSESSVENLRVMLTERSDMVARLEKEFGSKVKIERDTAGIHRGLGTYPEHVREFLMEKGRESLPCVFIDGKVVFVGKFPSYEEFRDLIKNYV